MPAVVCDTESVYWCSGDFLLFYVRGRVHERFLCLFSASSVRRFLVYLTLVLRARRYFVSRGVVVRCLMST